MCNVPPCPSCGLAAHTTCAEYDLCARLAAAESHSREMQEQARKAGDRVDELEEDLTTLRARLAAAERENERLRAAMDACGLEDDLMSDYTPYSELAVELAQADRALAERTRENKRLAAWLEKIEGGESPCLDEVQLRQWAYEAITLGKEPE